MPIPYIFRIRHLTFSNDKQIHSEHNAGIRWLDLDPIEDRYLLSCASDGGIAVHDVLMPSPPINQGNKSTPFVATHSPLHKITRQHPESHKSSVSCIIWYPVDTGLFLSGSRDATIKVWDANSLVLGCSFQLCGAVHAIAMSHAPGALNCLVAAGSDESDVALCDIRSGACAHRLSGHSTAVWTVAWSRIKEWELASGGRDGQVRVWDVRRAGTRCCLDMHTTEQSRSMPQNTTNRPRQRSGAGGSGTDAHTLALSHDGGVTGLISSPDSLFWLSAGNDARVRLWHSAKCYNMLVHYQGTYNGASGPRQLAVTDDSIALFHPSGSSVQVFDVTSGTELGILKGGHFESINACAWSPRTSELFTGAHDQNIVAWAPLWAGRSGGRGDDDNSFCCDSDRDCWSD